MFLSDQIIEAGGRRGELLKVLSDTDQGLKAQSQNETELEKQLDDSNKRFNSLETKRDIALQELEKLEHSLNPKQMSPFARHREECKEKVNQSRVTHEDLVKHVQQEGTRKANLKQEIQKIKDNSISLTKSRDDAQCELNEMYAQVFNGNMSGLAEGDACKEIYDSKLRLQKETKEKWDKERLAMGQLLRASKHMQKSTGIIYEGLRLASVADLELRQESWKQAHFTDSESLACDAWLEFYEAWVLSRHVKGYPDFKNMAHRFTIVPKDCLDEDKRFKDRLSWANDTLQSLQTSVNRDLASCKEGVAKLRAELEQFETKAGEDIFEFVLSGKVEAQT